MRAAFTLVVFSVAALLALGMVMLYSSSMTQVGAHYMMLQLTWCGLGLVLCITAASLDYRVLQRLAWPLFGVAVALLALVLVPHVGLKINGARRWFGFRGVHLQPSEFAKLALVIALAAYAHRHERQMPKFWRGIGVPLALIGVVLALIVREPDRGTTILLAAVSGAMLVLAGACWKFILPPVVTGLAGFAFYLWRDPMVIRRLLAWWNPEESRLGVGYQSYEAMLALGAGGLTGLGLGNGRQKLGFVPEHHTDFIFSIIGEELGLVGTLGVVLGFVVLVLCGIYIARHARETFGMMLAFGITGLIGLQAVVNIGVVTSALPNKGLPLPFISYGGSNLLVMMTAVGLLLSIARHAPVEAAVPEAALDAPGVPAPQPT